MKQQIRLMRRWSPRIGGEFQSIYKGMPGSEEVFAGASSEDPAKENEPASNGQNEDPKRDGNNQEVEGNSEAGDYDFSQLQQHFVGHTISSPDDLVTVGKHLQQVEGTLGAFEQMVEKNNQLASIIEAIHGGKSFDEAVSGLGYSEIVPDKAEDPEAYADYLASKKIREAESGSRQAKNKAARQAQAKHAMRILENPTAHSWIVRVFLSLM